MGLFQNHMMAAAVAATADTGYTIDNSCRFNDDDTAYLERTPSSTETSNKIYTVSVWTKRGNVSGNYMKIFSCNSSVSNTNELEFKNDETLFWNQQSGGSGRDKMGTTALYRDPSAWYHIVLAIDSTQAVEANRFKLYVNGSQVTAFGGSENYPSLNDTFQWNINGVIQRVGIQAYNTSNSFDGYMAEFHNIDGQQLPPTDFGKTNDDGVWVPIEYTGSYGTNGFYLDFSSSGDLGNDVSGNNNDLTSSGLTAADQMTDTPTDNFCVLNSVLDTGAGHLYGVTLSEGNLKTTLSASALGTRASATISVNSGKWYWEGKYIGTAGGENYGHFGVWSSTTGLPTGQAGSGVAGDNEWWMSDDGSDNHDNTSSDTGLGTWDTNDIIQIALDMDARKMWFGRNNTYEGDPAAGSGESFSSIGDNIVPIVAGYGGGSGQGNWEVNFGQSSLAHTAPSGFNAVSTANITTPAVTDSSTNFQTEIYTGNGTAIGSGGKAVTFTGNADMSPDLVWIKNRDQSDSHSWYDTTRGTTKQLESDQQGAQTTESEGLTTFGSDGFTVGSLDQVNTSSEDFVSWNWTEGSAAGFDIVSYTGNGSNRTISHSVGAIPKMIIIKSSSASTNWPIYHISMGNTKAMEVNDYAGPSTNSNYWQDTTPTSSVFSLGTNSDVNTNTATYIAYLWAEVEGFSSFGSYVGNSNSDGPFIYTGFLPRMVIIKAINGNYNWQLNDTARNTYNVTDFTLFPNNAYDENSGSAGGGNDWDMVSNGFKLRTSGGNVNDGSTFMYAAFATSPFGGDGVAPVTAF